MLRRCLLSLFLLPALGPGAALARAAPGRFVSDRITVTVRGRGPDVILIPGLASTPAVWSRTARALEARHTVHLVSIHGFGDLPAGGNGRGQVIGPVANELRRYIAATGLSRPAVIGHSMGGLVALTAAADAGRLGGAGPGRVMVVDASPFFPALFADRATARDVEPLARLAYSTVLFLGAEAMADQGSVLGGRLAPEARSVFSTLGWQGGDRGVIAQALYEVMTLDLRPRLTEVAAPVTVVYGWSRNPEAARGRLDPLFRAAYRRLPRPARFEPIEGAEHMVMIDQPARFLAAVQRFLA
jgi:pimeloyl-[acyl-carrier protein] methyl ester esterase